MAITGCYLRSLLPLPKARRRSPAPAPAPNLRFPAARRPNRASLTPPPTTDDDAGPREIPPVFSLLAAAVIAPHAALAASGGAMGGRSSSSPSSSSSSSWGSSSSSSWGSSSSSSPTSYSSFSSATHESVGTATAAPPPVLTDAQVQIVELWATFFVLVVFAAMWHYQRPRTTVVKLQVALLGLAKPLQKELNEIAEKVEASNQRWYKFILTETIHSLSRHMDCCISSNLSADVKVGLDSWEEHFDKISMMERSKFDEETLCNLEGIKKKKEYSKNYDDFRNEYIVVTMLVAADGAMKFPTITRPADLEAALGKLNSIPAREIRGIHVLWTPQEDNDVLSEEKLLTDYPCLKPLCDY